MLAGSFYFYLIREKEGLMRGKEDEMKQFFRPSSLGLASSEAFLEEIELLKEVALSSAE